MIEIIGTISSILAVVGVIANNRRLRWCFLVWIVSNGLCAAIHIYAGIWSLFARDVVFFILAIEGWIIWGKVKKMPLFGTE